MKIPVQIYMKRPVLETQVGVLEWATVENSGDLDRICLYLQTENVITALSMDNENKCCHSFINLQESDSHNCHL